MYTRTWIYRACAVVTFALSVVGFIYLAFSANAISNIPIIGGFLVPGLSGVLISMFISAVFSYVESSAMYHFADMIDNEKLNDNAQVKRQFFVLPGTFYKTFGTVMFWMFVGLLSLIILGLIGCIIAGVTGFVNMSGIIPLEKTWWIIVLLILAVLLVIALLGAVGVVSYINYYVKFRALGGLIDISQSAEISNNTKNDINKINTNLLRGYCYFLYILSAVLVVATILILLYNLSNIVILLPLVFAIALTITAVAINGCYVDNIAKMVEHHQIKFGLFEKVNNK